MDVNHVTDATTTANATVSKVRRFAEYPDIWATAAALARGAVKTTDGLIKVAQKGADKHLIVLGGKSAGKTTLVSRYLDRTVEAHDTIGISYSYLKRQREDGSVTESGNIWEIGSSTRTADILEIISNPLEGRDIMVFVVVDVSKPEYVLSVLDNVLFPLNATIANFSEASVWLVGTKFDRQQSLNFELDKRQAIADILRQIASTLSFGLVYPAQQNGQDPKVKSILDNWFQGERLSEYPANADALKQIFVPHPPLSGGKREAIAKTDMERWKLSLNVTVLQKQAPEFRPAKDTSTVDAKLYAEAELDEAFSLITAGMKAKSRPPLR